MEIHISRKLVIIATALGAVLAGLVVVILPNDNLNSLQSPSTPGSRNTPSQITQPAPAGTNTPEEAAIAFAQAFYTVDYANYDGWLAALKAVSTYDGYAILTKSIAPAVWPEIEKAKTVTPSLAVDATDTGLVLDGDSQIGGLWQIRTVKVHLDPDHLWPTMKSGDFEALIMLAKQDGQWRFVSFITPDQVDQIKKGQQP